MMCKSIEKKARYWYVEADCDRRKIEAETGLDGIIVVSHWVPYGDDAPELHEPDQDDDRRSVRRLLQPRPGAS